MNRIIFCLLLMIGVCWTFTAESQQVANANLRVYTEGGTGPGNWTVKFWAENNTRQDYHIVVNFTGMTGYVCDCQLPFGGNVKQGRTLLFTLSPRESNHNFQYSWTYYRGKVSRQIREVDYILPVGHTREVEVMDLQSLESFVGKEENSNNPYYTYGFKVEKDEIIHAIRRGRVVEIVNRVNTQAQRANLNYSSASNYMVIQHEDGSETRYSILKKDGFLVDKLDFVEAGDPIAKAAGGNYASGPQFHIATSYLTWNRNKKYDEAYSLHYVQNKFATLEGGIAALIPGQTYTSIHSENLIVQEMTKREKKKRAKGKKK